MDFISGAVETAKSGYIGWIIVFLVLTAFEMLNPRGDQRLRGRVNGLAYWTVFIPLSAVAPDRADVALGHARAPAAADPAGLSAWAWTAPSRRSSAVLTAAIVNDFFFYWSHRVQHRWLWRYHAVHHSIRELNAVNSYHHASEAMISLLLYTIPTSLIVSDVGPALPYISLALWLHIVWIHSPTRAHFGPLRALFVDNRYHRIHHSLEERHFDRNFGAFTTLWDRLFGTAYFPARDQWPDVGLAPIDEPRTVARMARSPGALRERRRLRRRVWRGGAPARRGTGRAGALT